MLKQDNVIHVGFKKKSLALDGEVVSGRINAGLDRELRCWILFLITKLSTNLRKSKDEQNVSHYFEVWFVFLTKKKYTRISHRTRSRQSNYELERNLASVRWQRGFFTDSSKAFLLKVNMEWRCLGGLS